MKNETNVHFYYRFNVENKSEVFISTDKPVRDNIEWLYNNYPTEDEIPLGTLFAVIMRVVEKILISFSKELFFNGIDEILNELVEMDSMKETLRQFLISAYNKTNYTDIKSKENIVLYNMNQFLEVCIEDKNYCKFENVEKLMIAHSLPFPIADRIVVDFFYATNSKQLSEINNNQIKSFIEKSTFQQKQMSLFIDKLDIFNIQHYDYYKVETVSDLLLAILKVIFDNHKIISSCEQCFNYFIPLNRNDEKYCLYDNYTNNNNCKKEAKLQNQRKRLSSQSELQKMERSVRNMLYSKAFESNQHDTDSYYDFLSENTDFKTSIKNGEKTWEEYEVFIKSFYKRKFK